MQYSEEARALWTAYVPETGQAATVQGELVRAIEKLRDEAQRNGNVNWGSDHRILARYVRDTLLASKLFDAASSAQIKSDIKRLLDHRNPAIDDAPYDRLTDRIVEWSRKHPDPVPHEPNTKLKH